MTRNQDKDYRGNYENTNVGGLEVRGVATKQIVFAQAFTTVGGAAAEAITVTGVLATDTADISLYTGGTSTRTIVSAVCTENTVTITFSGDPGNDAKGLIKVLR